MRRAPLVTVVSLGIFALAGCRRHAATARDCQALLDRIVDLELHESGYRDPVVRERWQQDLRRRFAPELDRCRGMLVSNELRQCIETAGTSEQIVHRCLE